MDMAFVAVARLPHGDDDEAKKENRQTRPAPLRSWQTFNVTAELFFTFAHEFDGHDIYRWHIPPSARRRRSQEEMFFFVIPLFTSSSPWKLGFVGLFFIARKRVDGDGICRRSTPPLRRRRGSQKEAFFCWWLTYQLPPLLGNKIASDFFSPSGSGQV